MDNYTMKQSLFICSILGCNPNVPFGKTQLLLTTMVVSCMTSFGLLLFLHILFPGEDVMNLEVISNIFTCISSIGFRKEMRKIFHNIETIFWRIEDVANEAERTECKEILLQGRYTIHAWTFLFVLWLFLCLRIKSLPLKCYQPKWIPQPFLIALENVGFIVLSMGVIAIDGIIMSLFLMIAIQLKMLNREFKSMFDVNDEKVIGQKIVKLIQHHDFMLWFTSLINDTISASMVIFLGNVVSNLCIYLYHFSTMQAEGIKISAYFSKWYEHPRFKHHISMILARDSLGITITAGGIVKVDLETALRVVKLACSYYMFLKTVTEI
nr:unnamed protein product [Callosobruchus analis]